MAKKPEPAPKPTTNCCPWRVNANLWLKVTRWKGIVVPCTLSLRVSYFLSDLALLISSGAILRRARIASSGAVAQIFGSGSRVEGRSKLSRRAESILDGTLRFSYEYRPVNRSHCGVRGGGDSGTSLLLASARGYSQHRSGGRRPLRSSADGRIMWRSRPKRSGASRTRGGILRGRCSLGDSAHALPAPRRQRLRGFLLCQAGRRGGLCPALPWREVACPALTHFSAPIH
jgi:hypothetical protein